MGVRVLLEISTSEREADVKWVCCMVIIIRVLHATTVDTLLNDRPSSAPLPFNRNPAATLPPVIPHPLQRHDHSDR